jgi:hypothetical protein
MMTGDHAETINDCSAPLPFGFASRMVKVGLATIPARHMIREMIELRMLRERGESA